MMRLAIIACSFAAVAGFNAAPSTVHSRVRASSSLQHAMTFPRLAPSPVSPTMRTYVTDAGSRGAESSRSRRWRRLAHRAKYKAGRSSGGAKMIVIQPKPSLAEFLASTPWTLPPIEAMEAQLGATESEGAPRRYARRLLLLVYLLLV